ncbi:hypothetical protein FACHB389_30155 [Nostoc calcicola FACHB-389]|nr:helix-turn-helix domain-containing protein [Nostoc calcicola FACHB-3891]OKH23876.1 hypothetical protein FACHB389_30155 [Nostoc calcicola FACHB-389]
MSEDRKKQAVILLSQGLRPSEVARSLSVSRQAVSLWLKSETFRDEVEKARKDFLANQNEHKKPEVNLLEKIPVPSSETTKTFKSILREKELLLLEQIEMYIMPQLEQGSVRAAAILLKVSERRAKLLGLERKPYDILEAFETLVTEGCAPLSQMLIVSNGLDQIQQQLKGNTDVTRAIEE